MSAVSVESPSFVLGDASLREAKAKVLLVCFWMLK